VVCFLTATCRASPKWTCSPTDGCVSSRPTTTHPADARARTDLRHMALEVADLDGTYDQLLGKGTTSVLLPLLGRMAWVIDPRAT
jgi:hypothetical protein